MRALLFFILILVIFLLIRRMMKPRPAQPKKNMSDPKKMVACHYCGVHLPKEEALETSEKPGQYYCSAEHLTLDDKSSD